MLIQSVQDAENFLINCWNDTAYGRDESVDFRGCFLLFKLNPGVGAADTKMLRAIRMFQRHVELTYLLAKHGDLDRRLTDKEREKLDLSFTVRPGSTIAALDITKALKTIREVLPAHWSKRAVNLVTCGLLLAFVGEPYAGHYSNYRSATDSAQITANATVKAAEQASRAQIAVARIKADARIKAAAIADVLVSDAPREFQHREISLAHLAKEDPTNVIAFAVSDYVAWRPALLDLAPYGGSFQWGDSAPVPTGIVKAVAKSARKTAKETKRVAKKKGNPALIETPWVTEVLRTHSAPGAMRLGMTDA